MWLPISVCPRKCWYLLIKIHGVASQNTVIHIPPWEAQIMKMRKVKCLGRTEFGAKLRSVIWILKKRHLFASQQAWMTPVRLCRPTWGHSGQELRNAYRVTSGRDWVRVPSRSRGQIHRPSRMSLHHCRVRQSQPRKSSYDPNTAFFNSYFNSLILAAVPKPRLSVFCFPTKMLYAVTFTPYMLPVLPIPSDHHYLVIFSGLSILLPHRSKYSPHHPVIQ